MFSFALATDWDDNRGVLRNHCQDLPEWIQVASLENLDRSLAGLEFLPNKVNERARRKCNPVGKGQAGVVSCLGAGGGRTRRSSSAT